MATLDYPFRKFYFTKPFNRIIFLIKVKNCNYLYHEIVYI